MKKVIPSDFYPFYFKSLIGFGSKRTLPVVPIVDEVFRQGARTLFQKVPTGQLDYWPGELISGPLLRKEGWNLDALNEDQIDALFELQQEFPIACVTKSHLKKLVEIHLGAQFVSFREIAPVLTLGTKATCLTRIKLQDRQRAHYVTEFIALPGQSETAQKDLLATLMHNLKRLFTQGLGPSFSFVRCDLKPQKEGFSLKSFSLNPLAKRSI